MFNKKITMILSAIFLIIISIIISYYSYSSNHQSFNFIIIINEDYNMQLPINTPREAVEYAKDNKLFNQSKINEASEYDGHFTNWKIFADKIDTNWQVTIKSQGIIPSYSCIYSFDENGNPVRDNFIIKDCGWNK